MLPNFGNTLEDLTEVESHPAYQELCVKQMRELSKLSAKFASQRVQLAVAIKREGLT